MSLEIPRIDVIGGDCFGRERAALAMTLRNAFQTSLRQHRRDLAAIFGASPLVGRLGEGVARSPSP